MNGILGFAELLQEPELTGDQKTQYFKVIEESGYLMLNLINDLIDISKIESGQIDITQSEFNLSELILYLFNFFKPEANEK